jgi:lysophospholipase L1-like esterase
LCASAGCGDDPSHELAVDDVQDSPVARDASVPIVDAASRTADASTTIRMAPDAGRAVAQSGAPSAPASDAEAARAGSDAGADRQVGDAGGLPALAASVTLHVAGDSTCAVFPASDPTHRVGWAAVLQTFFGTGVQVDDAAVSGRSSKSFLDEGLWKALEAKLQPGDYVFVEFGHNDEKSDDPARYTDPDTTFRTNLKTYVSETRAAGGISILLTPISRRKFSGTKIVPTHGAYPAAVMAVAAETGTPLIDMTERTRVWLESVGPTASVALFATGDDTHLSAQGAREVAKLAVQAMRELDLPIAARLLP